MEGRFWGRAGVGEMLDLVFLFTLFAARQLLLGLRISVTEAPCDNPPVGLSMRFFRLMRTSSICAYFY